MNFKTLYTLYFVLVVMVVTSIVSIFVTDFSDGFMEEYNSARKDSSVLLDNSNAKLSWRAYSIPLNKVTDNLKIVKSGIPDDSTQLGITPQRIDVRLNNYCTIPNQGAFAFYQVIYTICSFVIVISSIVLLCLLYKLFRRMQKRLKERVVFSLDVASVIKWLGIVLIIISISYTLFSFFQNKAAQIVLEHYGEYEVDVFYDFDYIIAIFGVALLLVAEFFKIGYKIQEEQNLTV